MGHSQLTASLDRIFERAQPQRFAGRVHRIALAPYRNRTLSMRGAITRGGRYNPRDYFGCLYTCLRANTAILEMRRYFTVPPDCGMVTATIRLRLSRVIDVNSEFLLRLAGLKKADLVAPTYSVTRDLGARAWEAGFEALLAPSAADPTATNLVLLLDNQLPGWQAALARVVPVIWEA